MKRRFPLHFRMVLLVTVVSLLVAAAPVLAAQHANASLAVPLLVDSAGGRLYGRVSVEGVAHHVGVYSARDGKPLTSFVYPGPFALDAPGQRLFVLTAANQVAVLQATTGKVLSNFSVGAAPANAAAAPFLTAAPQYDAKAGQLLVFTGNVMHTVEPRTGKVLGSKAFDVQLTGCGTMNSPLPINRTFFDAESRLLYLEFTTYSCIPWVGYTVISYDLGQGQELSRQGTLPYTGLAAGGSFYAASWNRMGFGTIWTERNGKPATTRAGWSGGGPFGASPFQLDPKRLQLYQSSEGAIRIFDAFDMSLRAVVAQPARGTLAAYDPRTDQVYFVDGGAVRPFAASRLLAPAPAPEVVKVKAAPRQPVLAVVPSPDWAKDKAVFAVWSQPANATACYVFGQAGGTLLRSTDGGKSWLSGAAGLGKDCALITSLAVSPNYAKDRTLFAGVKGNGVFKSTDGGLSWMPSGTNLANMGVTGLALSPGLATDSTLFASVLDSGLQRSASGGATWQTLATSFAPVIALSPEFDRDGIIATYGMKAGGGAVQISEDRGERWRSVTAPSTGGPRLLSLAPSFSRWGVMFAGDVQGDLYRSGDRGASWERVLEAGNRANAGSGVDQMQLVYGPTEVRREVFLITSGARYENETRIVWGRMHRSADGGQTWSEMDAGGVVPTALAISPAYAQDRLLLVGTADGRILQIQPPVLQ